MASRGNGARLKGAAAERELANLIYETWGYSTHRGFTYYHQSDIVGLDGIHMEVKRQEQEPFRKFMAQAVEEAEKRKDGIPVVFSRKNRTEWLVCMRLDDFMDMYGTWRGDDG